MLINLKAMIVVLIVATAIFAIARPVCLRFMTKDDFARRRNIWTILTIAGFLTPSIWLYAAVAVPLLALAARKDTNPVALYVLVMHVVPPLGMAIPVAGINQLFDLTTYRILSFAILIPAAYRLMRSTRGGGPRGLVLMDVLLVAYLVLQLVLYLPYESLTNAVRRSLLYGIDVLVLYFVVSRTCITRNAIAEVMASFCLACATFAPLAVFETLSHWLLYEGIGFFWGCPVPFTFLMRGETLRATVSAGHSIPLGYMLAIGFGFWLYLRSRVQSSFWSYAGAGLMAAGMLAAYARAPWVVAAVIFFAYLALVPKGFPKLLKSLLVSAVLAGVLLVSPLGERVIDNLPFVGTVNADTVQYRERLAERSWEVIMEHPLFGTPFFMYALEDMRQGQGIIDLVNTYASIALATGAAGLTLFVGFFLAGMWNILRRVGAFARIEPDAALLGVNLLACMIGTLVMLATGSFGSGLAQIFYVLAGLAAGYAQAPPRAGDGPASPPTPA
jgi:hypothetical protein